ncbi:uncharacterized protein [Antedon mediterranea]|uniref:uncharacterized protein n=1 Tax=Antedon mediterranea TaxID=105859 RepID=UPI003AF69986
MKLLTLCPTSWSIKKTAEEFQVTQHLVRKSRELKKTNGILAEPDMKKGRSLGVQLIERVKAFYESDEFSGICPGKKEYVSIRQGNQKEHVQKRLLLVNLKELHLEYLKQTGDKIGFSKFCELRPRQCVTVNSKGMHCVCVCQQHQNVKLLVSAIPTEDNYKDLLQKLVCNVETRDCMMLSCNSCPGKVALMEFLTEKFSENLIDMDDNINYKQWMHTDRTTIVSLQAPLQEFLEMVCNSFDKLRQHHFVAKSQVAYLRSLKENIQNDTAIVLLDFAENYSFLIQDAIQGFYWENSQATLHPFVIYYREEGELKCLSTSVISDCLKHDTSAVHAFISSIIPYIKEVLPEKTRLIYFSDGAASQYKNYKNLSNLCCHNKDHALQAEWHFFATSHGKHACDGIGGTIKRLVAKASLQRPLTIKFPRVMILN